MKKLINIINNKIIANDQKRSLDVSSQPLKRQQSVQSKFITFPHRRKKLLSKIQLFNFQLHPFYQNQFRLARSNFEGNQFVINKKSKSKSSKIDNMDIQDQSPDKNCDSDQRQMPFQIQAIFQQTIQRGTIFLSIANKLARQKYFQKKQKHQNRPFEINRTIFMTLFLGFFAALIIYLISKTLFSDMQSNQAHYLKESEYIFLGVWLTICVILVLNVWWSLCSTYTYFNYDYEAIKVLSQLLKDQNQRHFNKKGYKLTCDLQITWILLRPIKNDRQNQQQRSF